MLTTRRPTPKMSCLSSSAYDIGKWPVVICIPRPFFTVVGATRSVVMTSNVPPIPQLPERECHSRVGAQEVAVATFARRDAQSSAILVVGAAEARRRAITRYRARNRTRNGSCNRESTATPATNTCLRPTRPPTSRRRPNRRRGSTRIQALGCIRSRSCCDRWEAELSRSATRERRRLE